jgi:peptidoglycan/xylan/chitin deacetylase (PgdA/CDA1 family)
MGCSVLSAVRANRLLEARLRYLDAVVILNLHHVSPRPNPFWPGLHPAAFEDLVRFARETFDVVSVRSLAEPRPPERRTRPRLVFSFDDGYQDFLEYALPVIERHRIPVNHNLITHCVQTGEPLWHQLLFDFLEEAPASAMAGSPVPGFDLRFPQRPEDRLSYGVALSGYLKTRPRAQRDELMHNLRAVMDRVPFKRTRMMTADEIRQIAGRIEIGCHSHSHESMGQQSDEFFQQDLARARQVFVRELGLPCDIYAFPNGSYRPAQVQSLLEQGFKHVLLVGEQLAGDSTQVLPRITFWAQSAPEARLRALGWSPRGVAALQPSFSLRA